MRVIFTTLSLAVSLTAVACTKDAPPAPAAPPASAAATPDAGATALLPVATATPAERAAQAVAQLKGAVLSALTKAVADKGAAGAVMVCGEAAAQARDAVSAPDLSIGRTSSKLRNAGNTAPAWVAPAREQLEKAAPDARKPIEVALPDGGFGYVEPLVVAPLCLQCHGAAIAPDVKTALAARYPADQATGYAEGDLRGVVWVEIKATR